MKRKIISLMAMLCIFSIALTQTFVNSSTGNDLTGDGSQGNPYKTFHKGYIMTSSGGTLDLTGTFDWTDADETGDALYYGYTISKNLTLQGHGPGNTIVQSNAVSGISSDRRVFSITNNYTVHFNDLTLRHGKGQFFWSGTTPVYVKGGAIGSAYGSSHQVSIYLNNVLVSDNDGLYECAGVYSEGLLYAENCTFENNTGNSSQGIALQLEFSYTNNRKIINCTFFNNTSTSVGMATFVDRYGAHFMNCSFIENTNGIRAYAMYPNSAELQITNCILANNIGYDIYNSSGSANGVIIRNSIVEVENAGTAISYTNCLTGDQANLNLITPTTNGGDNSLTPYIALNTGSVAIDGGASGTFGSTYSGGPIDVPCTDQRNFYRSGGVDMGSYEFNGSGSPSVNPPTTQASEIVFSSVTYSGMTLNWTIGDGSARAVFIKLGSSGTATPIDDNAYTANTAFGNGTQIGTSGWYCIYNGTGNSVSITGLSEQTTFIVHVCEYNTDCSGNIISYQTASGSNNPNTQSTTEAPPIEDFETGDFTKFPWSFSGNDNWTIVSSGQYAGNYSAKSGPITHSQSTTMQVTLNILSSGNITFYRKISSEGSFDYLRFYIDGSNPGTWSGSLDWALQSYAVNAGIHTFKWTYSKDGSVSSGSDCAWVDDIIFPAFDNVLTWTGSVSSNWNTAANWNGNSVPTSAFNASVPFVSNAPVISDGSGALCNNLTVENGAILTIQSGGSLITGGAITNNGTIEVQKEISDGQWHLISSSITDATAATFMGDYLQTYDEASDSWPEVIDPATVLIPGKGYALWGVAKSTTHTFTGTPSTGNVSNSFTYTPGGNPDHYGFNLMGNPYPSSIDWDLLNESYGAVYYYDGTNYLSWNGVGAGSQYIPPMQGFMIAPGTAGSLDLNNSFRTHLGASNYYKSSNQNNSTLVLMAGNNSMQDELFINFNEDASTDFDLQFDAWKIITQEENIAQIFSIYDQKRLSIDQQPEFQTLPIGFFCSQSGEYVISIKDYNYEGVLYLEDLLTGTIHNLNEGTYSFSWDSSEAEHRFNLHFSPMGIQPITQLNPLTVYTSGNTLFINVSDDMQQMKVFVYDITGRIMTEQKLDSNYGEINMPWKTGIYLVTVISGNSIITEKVYLN